MQTTIFTVPLAIIATAATLLLSAGPAAASENVCQAAPGALRSVAAAADTEVQARAMRHIALGEQLCEARNRVEAGKKFNLAAKALGIDLATVINQTRTASSL